MYRDQRHFTTPDTHFSRRFRNVRPLPIAPIVHVVEFSSTAWAHQILLLRNWPYFTRVTFRIPRRINPGFTHKISSATADWTLAQYFNKHKWIHFIPPRFHARVPRSFLRAAFPTFASIAVQPGALTECDTLESRSIRSFSCAR